MANASAVDAVCSSEHASLNWFMCEFSTHTDNAIQIVACSDLMIVVAALFMFQFHVSPLLPRRYKSKGRPMLRIFGQACIVLQLFFDPEIKQKNPLMWSMVLLLLDQVVLFRLFKCLRNLAAADTPENAGELMQALTGEEEEDADCIPQAEFIWQGEWMVRYPESGNYGVQLQMIGDSFMTLEQNNVNAYHVNMEKDPADFQWADGTIQTATRFYEDKVVWETNHKDPVYKEIVWERVMADDVKTRYMDFKMPLYTLVLYWFCQVALAMYFIYFLNADASTHDVTQVSFVKWVIATVLTMIVNEDEAGAAYDGGSEWDDVREKAKDLKIDTSKWYLNGIYVNFTLETHIRQYLFDAMVNGLVRSLILAVAPIMLSTEEPMDFIKDVLALFFIVKLDDIEGQSSLVYALKQHRGHFKLAKEGSATPVSSLP
mmetsp:Transcript_112493/g.363269  ORF Transcript_112493/g.363269 Transcript_112493/m.363269 type:complete len:430 (+) Transcript_112493:66-1355(+)